MKTIGLIGGMSWESTATYYKLINEGVKNKLGGMNGAKLNIISLNIQEMYYMIQTQGWEPAAKVLCEKAKQLEDMGSDFLMICANTPHKAAPQIEETVNIPLLHIADPTAEAIKKKKISTIGLLGTNFTMEEDFYKSRLKDKHGLNVLVPDKKEDRDQVNRIIFEELVLGITKDESRKEYLRIMNDLTTQGAEGVILGCTEIAHLVNNTHTNIPLFDTTELHAAKAVEMALDASNV